VDVEVVGDDRISKQQRASKFGEGATLLAFDNGLFCGSRDVLHRSSHVPSRGSHGDHAFLCSKTPSSNQTQQRKRMKKIIAALIAAGTLIPAAAGVAEAGPPMCSGHSDHDSWANGPKGSEYVTACGGDSGPDATGNNATAPSVSTKAS
jgi:hypothetical protein